MQLWCVLNLNNEQFLNGKAMKWEVSWRRREHGVRTYIQACMVHALVYGRVRTVCYDMRAIKSRGSLFNTFFNIWFLPGLYTQHFFGLGFRLDSMMFTVIPWLEQCALFGIAWTGDGVSARGFSWLAWPWEWDESGYKLLSYDSCDYFTRHNFPFSNSLIMFQFIHFFNF